jgi:hypothetical protein
MNVRGLKVVALQDSDGAVWFADDEDPDIFSCLIGDRTMHIDELAGGESQDAQGTAED